MYVTLNITATSVRLLSMKGDRVDKWGDMPLPPGYIRDGLILQPKAVGFAIDALFKSKKISKEQVIVSLSGLPFTHRILSLPQMKRMKPELLEEAIERAARREISLPLEDLYFSWQEVGSKGDELEFFVLGAPRKLIDAVVQALTEAGITSYLIDLKPLALARAANRKDALIVSLESDCFNIVLVSNGIPVVMHTTTPKGEGASIEDKIGRLSADLSRTMEFYNSGHPENPLNPDTPLLLTGELSTDTATSELIQAQTGYAVELLSPALQFSSDLPLALYAANMGLALKKMAQKTAAGFFDINLDVMYTPDKHKAKAPPVPLRERLRTAALVITIGLAFFMSQASNQASAESLPLFTQLQRVTAELRQARLASEEAKQTEDTINEIVAEAEGLAQEHQQILNNENYFANTLRLVTDALSPEIYFISIDIRAAQIVVEGEARRPSVVIRYATALEQKQPISEVRIAEIEESSVIADEDTEEENTAVSFTIVITRQEQER